MGFVKVEFQLFRKMVHFSGILIPVIYFTGLFDNVPFLNFTDNTRSFGFYILLSITLTMLSIDLLRFYFPSLQRVFIAFLEKTLKEDEYRRMLAAGPFFLAHTVLFVISMKPIAILSMLFLLIGDPAAAYFGSKYGRYRLSNGRSIEGTLSGIIVSIIVGFVFLIIVTLVEPNGVFVLWDCCGFHWKSVIILIAGAFSAFIIELFSPRGLFDDNFSLPLGSTIVMLALFSYWNDVPFAKHIYSFKDLLFMK